MRLNTDECLRRLAASRHGVLSTVHPARGVDAVPVVFALDDRTIFIPVDSVKQKSGARLRRLANVDADPRCVLLVDHWSDDWSRLWWVRAHGVGNVVDGHPNGPWFSRLAERYPQYARPHAIVGGIEITITELMGWAASEPS